MAHTTDAVIYDLATMIVQMIVIPEDDAQLADPSFNPAGMSVLLFPHVPNGNVVALALAALPALLMSPPADDPSA
jgi:hypothetical protein